MRKEFGKWLMDIAKYITTAVILSTVFGDITESWIVYVLGALTVIVSLCVGLWLVREPKQKQKGGI